MAPNAQAIPKSLKGLYTAGKKRKQEIRTPRALVEAFADALGGAIPLDPCATRSPLFHFAQENWPTRGLVRHWERPSYSNPPWRYLFAWLMHARIEAARTGLPTILLGPLRPHRTTFCSLLDGRELVLLKAVPFEGHANTHPYPVFVAAWNLTLPRLPLELGRATMRAASAYVPKRVNVAR